MIYDVFLTMWKKCNTCDRPNHTDNEVCYKCGKELRYVYVIDGSMPKGWSEPYMEINIDKKT